MNTLIEDNLTLSLARIFTAYGWNGNGAPSHWQDKLDIIRYGLYHGDALAYATHLKLLLQARRKDKQWGLFTPEFVYGISLLLDDYAENNDLYKIKAPAHKKVFSTSVSSANIFTDSPILKRLKAYDRTVISYTLVEEYGTERLLSDLRIHYPKATLSIDYDVHQPDQIRNWVYDDGSVRMTTYLPLMPIVIVTTGKKR